MPTTDTPTVAPTGIAAEATGAPLVAFDFLGAPYLAAPSTEWSWDALEAYESGKIISFLSAILDPASLKAFKATRPTVLVFGEFVVAMQTALGISGN